MHGTEDETAGSILKHMTEAEFKEQHHSWPGMTPRAPDSKDIDRPRPSRNPAS